MYSYTYAYKNVIGNFKTVDVRQNFKKSRARARARREERGERIKSTYSWREGEIWIE